MSGSQHNPNGRQSQLGSGWSPLQMANLLARAPQAHMASDRGVTWHTPTPPPPHLYHVPAPSPPDPLQALSQAMKTAGSNSVFRHTATPPELYRHTPTPPDKHLIRHTPSPGDVKGGAPLPPVDLYPHLGPTREKLVRAEELVAYARVGVDLSLGSRANGAPPALSVRDAPTINSLIARAAPRRVDALLERLAPSPHSVIVHPRTHTPSPPSSNEDSGDSCGGAGGMKRKRKPERTHRLPAPAPAHAPHAPHAHDAAATALTTHPVPPSPPPPAARLSPPPSENGDIPHDERNGPPSRPEPEPAPAPAPAPAPPPRQEAPAPPGPQPPPADTAVTADTDNVTVRRKTRSGSAETIADIAAMIASETPSAPPPLPPPSLSVDKLKSVLASPEPAAADDITQPSVESAAAPRRRAARDAMLPVESPCEGKPAEPPLPPATQEPEPSACFVEVENQLEKMFAGIEEPQQQTVNESAPTNKRRKSGASRGRDAPPRRKGPRKKPDAKPRRKDNAKDKDNCVAVREGYDSGSNASSGRSRGPYIQIRGPRESPVSVCVMNAGVEEEIESRRRGSEKRRGLHASTLGLRYDASTRDATWLCAFCGRGPHAAGLGDLFGPYPLDGPDAWLHADCGVWAPGVLAAGSRVWGLARAVKTAAAARCQHCAHAAAPVACSARGCAARAHLPCARDHAWTLREDDFRALCPHHSP